MAYPYEITDQTSLIYRFCARPYRKSNGDLYAILNDLDSPGIMSVWRSTDAGLTWAEQDDANNPTTLDLGGKHHYNTAFDGTKIWAAFCPGGTDPPTESYLKAFNTTTNLWETSITGGPPSVATLPHVSPAIAAEVGIWLVIRANGDKVVIYTDRVQEFGFGDYYNILKFKVYNGSTWSSAVDLMVYDDETFLSRIDYQLMGAVLTPASGRIWVWAATLNGIHSCSIETDNSVTNQRRFDQEVFHLPQNRDGFWGNPTVATFNSVEYAVLPMAFLAQVYLSESNTYYPTVMMIRDDTGAIQFNIMNETVERVTNWLSVVVDFDSSTGSLYVLWNKVNGNESTQIRVSCNQGTGWSTPSDFFASAAGGLIETIEIQASGGTLRMFIENSDGDAPYLWPHYYQGAVASCGSAAAAPTNFAFLGEG